MVLATAGRSPDNGTSYKKKKKVLPVASRCGIQVTDSHRCHFRHGRIHQSERNPTHEEEPDQTCGAAIFKARIAHFFFFCFVKLVGIFNL